jgi:metal-responsive CopG/Arc/MetJ family transcriptional regulator
MDTPRKVKISVSIAADVLEAVDRLAASEGTTRSEVVERWLRELPRRATAARLDEQAPGHHGVLTAAERAEDNAWAALSDRAQRAR